jgi:F420H(2)-dependent quinone reductase
MSLKDRVYRLKQQLYRDGRPNWFASAANRFSGFVHGLGIAPNYLVTLEVRGRQSGRTLSLPLVMAVVDGERYLVSMLGPDVNWVRNARAAGGHVTIRHGRCEQVHLEEVSADQRAPILKAYLKRAPGARPHVVVDKDAPLSEFEKVAAQYPVFRVVPESATV